ncbi:MAG: efflux transporter outer membrane subunit [Pseudoxanthomonas suwonensis]|nr:efflux transporter outer membrane subunit [Pseudoxanthomonas suwonensis]
MTKLAITPLALAASLMLAGCATLVPPMPAPQAGIPSQLPAAGTVENVSVDTGWRDFFIDPRLQQVVALAVDNNRDLRMALANVERARAQHRIQQAERVPALGASGSLERVGGDVPVSDTYTAGVGLAAFELDLFGRVRNLSEAALQQFFAQEQNRRAAQVALVAETANLWLAVAADRERLAIADATQTTYDEALRLAERRHEIGVISGLELEQARSQAQAARADAAQFRGHVAQDINALNLLAGTTVDPALLPATLTEQPTLVATLPAGIDSGVLLQRPDVLAAEHGLAAANANIGAARAAFFPRITLTGSAGSSSAELSDLFSAGTRIWRFMPSISIPIFQGGRRRAGLGMAEADRDVALAGYEKAIQVGFREVADALVLAGTLDEQRQAREALLQSATRAEALSKARYDAGRDSYLQRLDAQRTLYAAQQGVLLVRQQLLGNRIALYRALGGGWREHGAAGQP